MNQNKRQKQVSLAGVAEGKKAKGSNHSKQKEKKPFPWEWLVVAVVPLIAILSVLGFLYVIGTFDSDDERSLTGEQMVPYTVTAENMKDNVSYFALGITGEVASDRMDAVAVMCYDRKNGTISVVQMPVTTYLGKDTDFAVKTLGDVWGNPQPVPFCSSHKTKLTEEEIENNTHVDCGAVVELRKGSSFGDLTRVFNEQYGLPIDNYFVIPRNGLVQLIDELGGVDIKLSQRTTLDGETYGKGIQTLPGKAAVTYMTTYNYKGTAESDRTRMLRQRAVFSAVLQRISECRFDELYQVVDEATTGIFGRLMIGEYPIRFDSTSFSKGRMLGMSKEDAGEMKDSEAIAQFFYLISKVPQEHITCSILPGESTTSGSTKVYSVNRKQTITLLNEQMNPYGLDLNEETVTVQQAVLRADKADLETATLASVAQPQTGRIEPEVEEEESVEEEEE